MVRKIAGKNQPTPRKHLIKNIQITNIKDITDTLADLKKFLLKTPKQNSINTKLQKKKLNFQSDNIENYNESFTLSKLREAIQKSHNTTVGPDDVHCEFLGHLPPKSFNYLSAFNEFWRNGTFPESWKMVTIIPIPKPGEK